MKASTIRFFHLLAAIACAALCASVLGAEPELDIRTPPVDAQGRFWVYGHPTGTRMLPFIPHGVMPPEAGPKLKLDVESKVKPFPENPTEGEAAVCAAVSINWDGLAWCGCAWIAGPDGFWGETNKGTYYDLSKFKRLVFHARGATGNERIRVKVGALGDKEKYGDSSRFPVASSWIRLTTEWGRHELDLTGAANQLRRITNGFTFVAERIQQDVRPKTTEFFLDAIYFE